VRGEKTLRTIFQISNDRNFALVKEIYDWIEGNAIFFTFSEHGSSICSDNNVKYRYIRDIRVLAWEMARWEPKTYVDTVFAPEIFPRNGEKTIFMPSEEKLVLSPRLLLYDFIFSPTDRYQELVQSEVGADSDKITVIGAKQEGNTALKTATLIHRIGVDNKNISLSLPSSTKLDIFP
jgi:hypothetical protein